MTCSQTPPMRKSIFLIVVLKPRGPHQRTTCCGSVHACHTSSRGASTTREITISRSEVPGLGLFFAVMFLLVGLAGDDGRGGPSFVHWPRRSAFLGGRDPPPTPTSST